MSKELNKALDLLREIRPSIPKDVLELWCKDRDAFLASHKATVEQAGGDELEKFLAWACKEYGIEDKYDLNENHHSIRENKKGWMARAALAQPSPAQADEKPGDSILCYGCFAKGVGPEHFDEAGKCLVRQQTEPLGAEFSQVLSDNLPELLSTAQAEQAEAERPDVVAVVRAQGFGRVCEADANALYQHCSDGETLMTVAQHERIAASRWERAMDLMGEHVARISDKLTAERDAALAEVERIKTISDNYYVLCVERQQQLDAALARVAELEKQERPEVAEVAFVLRNIGAMDAEDIDGDNVDLRFEDAEGRDTGCDVSIVEYAEKAADLFEQHDRIVGELRTEIAMLRSYESEWELLLNEHEQQRDAALARVSGLRSLLNPILCYVENDIERMRGDRDKSDNKEIYDLAISLAMERLKAAQHAVFTTEPGCDTAVELASHITAQAQHSVPEEFIGRLSEFLAQRGATGKALLRELRALFAAAPGKEGV